MSDRSAAGALYPRPESRFWPTGHRQRPGFFAAQAPTARSEGAL